MYRYKIIISYDGTSFSGWQLQPNGITIQGLIEEALCKVFKTLIRVIGSGRTDAGVHALGQTAHFDLEECFDPKRLAYILNGMLPHDIRILECSSAPDTFHARRALGKEYHYHVWNDRPIPPFVRLYRYYFPRQLSLSLIREGAKYFVGTHDFGAFANLGSSAKTSIRTITRLDIVEQEGGFRLEFEGNGFLYKMVRNITGALLEVGIGKSEVEEIATLFAKGDRRDSAAAVPANGLFLVKVTYPTMECKELTCENSFPSRCESSTISLL